LRKRRPAISRKAAECSLSLFIFLCLIAFSPAQDIAPDLSRLSVGDWKTAGPSEVYKKEGLFGYIDGGAELFLQYGFEELSITRYVDAFTPNAEKEITIEAYRMAAAADAFGIFSLKREGDERVSPEIEAVHWLSPTQASLVKGNLYISINGMNTVEAELQAFAAAVSKKTDTVSALPTELTFLPSSGRVQGSERYIRGKLAAEGESLLLDREFWGFEKGTVAVSAKYLPSRSKLIVIIPESPILRLTGEVRKLFSEYLEEVAIRDGLVGGQNAAGRWFLFCPIDNRAFLVVGEPDYATAERLIRAAAQK
jgi:hypothetical protein